MMRTQTPIRIVAVLAFALVSGWLFAGKTSGHQEEKKLDPAAWGSNHVGKPVPEFVHGDECLFCHRNTVGATWQKNAHGVAVRQLEDAGTLRDLLKQPELASVTKDIEYFLGSRHRIRFLKKDGFGKFALLNSQAVVDASGKATNWIDKASAHWDTDKFGNNCAGCHATGVDANTKSFAAFGLDCYVCHGEVNLDHANDTKLMILSKKRRNEAELITSTCAQCHLRESQSKSTGLPYPNNFVAGDNLFQDLVVDWSKADDEKLNPIDRHIYRNVRDVVMYGKTSPTCINCHQVHYESKAQSIARHKIPPRSPLCFDCHVNESPLKAVKPYTMSSKVCEYERP
jgi:hypothetical protein